MFAFDSLKGKPFARDTYPIEELLNLDVKMAKFTLFFHAAKAFLCSGKHETPVVFYFSGMHRYYAYHKLKEGESAVIAPQAYISYEKDLLEWVDFGKREISFEENPQNKEITIKRKKFRFIQDRDYNTVLYSLLVSEYYRTAGKKLYEPRNFSGLKPYAVTEYGRKMERKIFEYRPLSVFFDRTAFVVYDQWGDVLELGTFTRAFLSIYERAGLNRAEAGKVTSRSFARLATDPAGNALLFSSGPTGVASEYYYQYLDRLPMDHPLEIYADPSAALYCDEGGNTLYYVFHAYGRQCLELHFANEADYYTMGNFLTVYILMNRGKTGNSRNTNGDGKAEPGEGSAKNTSTDPGRGNVSASPGQTLGQSMENAKTEEPETDPMEELNALVGMDNLKQDVKELVSLVKMQKLREEKGMKAVPVTLHLVFTGNPGTGKTTVARILGRLYKDIGVLSKGQMVETDRSGLVAGYIGHTAQQTARKIEEAMGGILFIDEAYTLVKEGNDFGQEAIDTLLKAMEDHRKDFVVIVAGYDDLMEKFINSNPGLKSRFNKYLHFDDYSAEELIQIFERNCEKYEYRLSDEARTAAESRIRKLVDEKDKNFANAREVRNLFETVITNQAARVAELKKITEKDMVTLSAADFE